MPHDDWIEKLLREGTLESVTWTISAEDPYRRLLGTSLPQPSDQDIRDKLAEFTITRGIILWEISDDDESGGVPYCDWMLRVPASLHRQSIETPAQVAEVLSHLQRLYPDLARWEARPDSFLTEQSLIESILRRSYADLIDELEVALLPLRTKEAARVEAMIHGWGADDKRIVGTYALPLTSWGPGRGWLLVHAGIADLYALDGDDRAATEARRFGVLPDHPLLTLPRPEHALFYAQIESIHGGINEMLRRTPPRVPDLVCDFRWTSPSPQLLAQAIKDAAPGWWPKASD